MHIVQGWCGARVMRCRPLRALLGLPEGCPEAAIRSAATALPVAGQPPAAARRAGEQSVDMLSTVGSEISLNYAASIMLHCNVHIRVSPDKDKTAVVRQRQGETAGSTHGIWAVMRTGMGGLGRGPGCRWMSGGFVGRPPRWLVGRACELAAFAFAGEHNAQFIYCHNLI